MKFGAYACLSTLLAASTVTYAVQQKQQFYPTVVFLVTSKFSIVVLVNFALVLTLILGRITKSIFLGRLRDAEREIVYDNVRYAIPETCVALTIFHEELNIRVFGLFTILLFSKVFHWLSHCRVEHVEQADALSRLTHVRLVALIFVLLFSDAFVLGVCTYLCVQNGPSVLILFGFEYAILSITVLATLVRYVLHLIDLQVEGTWNAKASYVFFLEFLTEALRFMLFMVFFMIVFTYYGMPFNIIRELYGSYNNLRQRLTQFRNYRKLVVNLNERFPDATEDELEACEHTCIICRDHMAEGKKLPCGHIFHVDCLRLWLQQQQTCPTCRAPIPVDPPTRARPARVPPAVPQAQAAAPIPGAAPEEGEEEVQAGRHGPHFPAPGASEDAASSPSSEQNHEQPAVEEERHPPISQAPTRGESPVTAAPAASTPQRTFAGSPRAASSAASPSAAAGSPGPRSTGMTGSAGLAWSPQASPFGSMPMRTPAAMAPGSPFASPFGIPVSSASYPGSPLSFQGLGIPQTPNLVRVVASTGAHLYEQPLSTPGATAGPGGTTRTVPPGAVLIVTERQTSSAGGAFFRSIDGDWLPQTLDDGSLVCEEIPAPPPIIGSLMMPMAAPMGMAPFGNPEALVSPVGSAASSVEGARSSHGGSRGNTVEDYPSPGRTPQAELRGLRAEVRRLQSMLDAAAAARGEEVAGTATGGAPPQALARTNSAPAAAAAASSTLHRRMTGSGTDGEHGGE